MQYKWIAMFFIISVVIILATQVCKIALLDRRVKIIQRCHLRLALAPHQSMVITSVLHEMKTPLPVWVFFIGKLLNIIYKMSIQRYKVPFAKITPKVYYYVIPSFSTKITLVCVMLED